MSAYDESAPHSRGCGARRHSHGPECGRDCPTCHGQPTVPTLSSDEALAELRDRLSRPRVDPLAQAVEILIRHQRTSIEGCRCGWADLGRSYAEHVARALDSAGLITEEN